MQLTRDNCYATVTAATEDELSWLRLALRYETRTGGRFGGRPTVPVLDSFNNRFPAGLLPELVATASAANVPLVLDDQRAPLPPAVATDLSGWLDADQLAAIAAVLQRGRGILQLATGAGKTELFLAVAFVLYPHLRALFLAPRAILAEQAMKRGYLRMEEGHYAEEEIGMLADGVKRVRRVTCGTFQTMHSALASGHPSAEKLLDSVDIIVGDECHTCAADTFFPVLMAAKNARIRLGLSASPLQRTDERSILTVGAFGPVIHEVKAAQVVASGRIVAPTITMYRCLQYALRAHPRDTSPGRACLSCPAIGDEPCTDDCATMDPRGGMFRRVYNELVVESDDRNALLVRVVALVEKPALLFVKDLRHGKALTSLCSRVVQGVRFVNGSKSTTQRAGAIRELQRGEIELIVCTGVFEAGVDIPELRSVGNAGAGMSAIRSVQMLGRVLRASPGKTAATMFDVLDEGEPSLARHANQRRKAYVGEGFKVHVADMPIAGP